MATGQNETKNTQPAISIGGAENAPAPSEDESAAAVVESRPAVSSFIKMSDGSRTKADAVATVSRNGAKLYLKDRYDNFLIILEFEYEEDAEAEMNDVNDQLDRYEAARGSRPASRTNGNAKRKLHRR